VPTPLVSVEFLLRGDSSGRDTTTAATTAARAARDLAARIVAGHGTVAGNGMESALRAPGLEPDGQTMRVATFMSNGGAHVTPAQAAFIATRLRKAVGDGVVADLLSLLDDAPGSGEVTGWVQEFAAFNEKAAEQDGYYVC
jgi:hypothetical protein